MSRKRKACIILLTCLGAGPKHFLQFSEDFSEKYYIKDTLFHDLEWLPRVSERIDDVLEDAGVLIYHAPDSWPAITDEQLANYEGIIDKFPSDVQKISIPHPHFHAFWPYHCHETRNTDRTAPPNRYGFSPFFNHGDSFVLKLLREGIPPDEVAQRYLNVDLAKQIDLDRDLRRCFALLERHDRTVTVKVTNYIADTFRIQKVFSNVNHVNNRVLFYMTNEILKLVGCRPLPEQVLDRTADLLEGEVPIHPSIGRYHKIPYITPTARYLVDHVRYLTFAEFLQDYVHMRDGLVGW